LSGHFTEEGRDRWVIEITNKDTGVGESKPAMWLDGNMHTDEVNGRQWATPITLGQQKTMSFLPGLEPLGLQLAAES
jgi:hypothetical protein